jgi:hypothetical protein
LRCGAGQVALLDDLSEQSQQVQINSRIIHELNDTASTRVMWSETERSLAIDFVDQSSPES